MIDENIGRWRRREVVVVEEGGEAVEEKEVMERWQWSKRRRIQIDGYQRRRRKIKWTINQVKMKISHGLDD